MAGHSKWANIKHKKAAVDAKKGKVFSKIAKETPVGARVGGGDPAANISLRALVQKARSVNMPADNIERAIKKGTGELKEDVTFEELTYEGYAVGGIAIIVEVLTDNKNRSASEVRLCFTKAGASFSSQGSVSRNFQRKGMIMVPTEGQDEDSLMELALENGAEDFAREDEHFNIVTEPNDFMPVVDAFNEKSIPMDSSEVQLIPDTTVEVTAVDKAKKLMNFIDALEDNDDVQNVWSNFSLSEDVITALNAE